ncbi:MAG: hypothetical protein ACODAQ_05760, partial [Phycisphaeraceae bacterium]
MERPTFNESWHQVADVKARLRGFVQVYRQFYRGRLGHVLRDPSNNRFFHLNDAAYHFVGLLNGQRTVSEAWALCNTQLGDRAPTQGEVIQLLGQLYSSNLLTADLPPDAANLFERQRKRVRREVRGYLMNLLFARIPLLDPDRLLDHLARPLGWIFSPIGFACWAILLITGLWALVGNIDQLWHERNQILALENLLVLYLAFAGIKALHELGHGLACKRFGEAEQVPGEVHQVGIMLLVLMPVPYVDASSAWAFRSKWRRAAVGLAGIYVELAAAAVAMLLWSRTAPDTLTHAIAYNVIFIASVSTLLFNGNPLLRFDGYYVLSDLLEIPNLNPRSKQYLYYLVKRYVYGVRAPQNPAHTAGERPWLIAYAVASTIYRVIIAVGIILFITGKFFFIGALLAISAVVGWVAVPLGRFVHYLLTSPELLRTRPRAVLTSTATIAALIALLGGVPVPDHGRAQGIVEPARFVRLHTRSAGFLERAADEPLVQLRNDELRMRRRRLDAERRLLEARYRQAFAAGEFAAAQQIRAQQTAFAERVAELEQRITHLTVRAPFEGQWMPARLDRRIGGYLERGEPLGWIAGDGAPVLRIAADQYLGPQLASELAAGAPVEVRAVGAPQRTWTGTLERISPAGVRRLPSAALGHPAGGPIAMDT